LKSLNHENQRKPEETQDSDVWLRELRVADGTDLEEYLDYLFGSTKYETGGFEDEAGR
jgi:hypothetical protein